ncbi:hypothetical protein SAMN04488494_1580 [Xylanibacter ruminicola]|uniref:Uncharacterized protein n=1 Tax=Xylanibacter ruminicola TaxID=839 RepID=A0A1M7GVZ7_XYLRU|nr:hypothetical protein SAMN04488494_1580 [Xylanibacter ruminicola]
MGYHLLLHILKTASIGLRFVCTIKLTFIGGLRKQGINNLDDIISIG